MIINQDRMGKRVNNMNFQNLTVNNDSGIVVLTVNRPQSLNALNVRTIAELDAFCDQIAEDSSIKVIIITGAGEKAFVAGADIAEMRPMSPLESRIFSKRGQKVFSKIENLHQPVIAAVNGFALGGGCELALACDMRIAAEHAKFGQPEVTLGITPGYGGTQRLSRLIGKGRAMELLLTGEIIGAQDAYRIGLVNKVVSSDKLMEAVIELAQKIMKCSPVAVKLTKAAVNEGMNLGMDVGMSCEASLFGLCFAADDQQEGMAAFLEKRKAHYS